jgi:hypothetical protein
MTSCSLRRPQELAAQRDQRWQPPNRCASSYEGVGTREQLVRVPIQHSTMTSCSLRRPQELAAQRDQRWQPPNRCASSYEGVGTREQLVRVPIQHSTMTSCSLRRLQELAAQRDQRWAPPNRCDQATKESERLPLGGPFRGPGSYDREWQLGLREDHGDD